MSDMNAQIGKSKTRSNTGKFSLHDESDDNCERLYDFALSRDLVISSTMFPHKDIHLQTWISPDGFTKTQIDHILIKTRHASDIMDVRNQRGADCDSDHFMIGVQYRSRLLNLLRATGDKLIKYESEKLKANTISKDYQTMDRI